MKIPYIQNLKIDTLKLKEKDNNNNNEHCRKLCERCRPHVTMTFCSNDTIETFFIFYLVTW